MVEWTQPKKNREIYYCYIPRVDNISIVCTKKSPIPLFREYRVSVFGIRLKRKFTDLDEAKIVGLRMARIILKSAIRFLKE